MTGLSIVATLYDSAKHLAEFAERVTRAAESLGVDYELVLVNDASPDDSLALALQLFARDEHVVVVDLARRYGHYEAMLAGLREARGELVFLIDSDLEEPPELLASLWNELRADAECDMAIACEARRQAKSMRDAGGMLFYRLLRAQTKLDIPQDNFVARLMTRRYVDALLSMRERPVSFDVLAGQAGFRHRIVFAEKQRRAETSYPFARRLALFADSLLAYHSHASTIMALLAIVVFIAAIAAPSRVTFAFAFAIIVLGIALLARYAELLLDEMRHHPAIVRRIHRHE